MSFFFNFQTRFNRLLNFINNYLLNKTFFIEKERESKRHLSNNF